MSENASTSFERALEVRARAVEVLLDGILSAEVQRGELVRPARLLAAMRHGVLNGGKRLRPFLVMESAALFGADGMAAARVAAALECVHCYSLIHDDLPAMDDDDLRRGKPTVHKAFDEATAILAGDALLTLAFDIIASPATDLPAVAKVELVAALARAAGIGGMAGGQSLDLAAELTPPDEVGIVTLQAMKTGALIRFACEGGAIVAGAGAEDRERLAAFGSALGLAFQLADDLLDLESDAATLGKATGKDGAAGKATLPSLHGASWTRNRLDALVGEAAEILEPFGARAYMLSAAAGFVASRKR
jgi:farnesyl diphosphate synthase